MGVITTEKISGGRLFGPIQKNLTLVDLGLLIGHMTCDNRPDVHKVTLDVNTYSEGARLGEWVPHVQAARDDSERNMEVSVQDGNMFYRATRTILANQQLYVWYSPAYAKALGIPPLLPDYMKDSDTFVCPRCRHVFRYPNCLRAHMRFKCHYTSAASSPERMSPRADAEHTSVSRATPESYYNMLLANNLTPPHSAGEKTICSSAMRDFVTSSPRRLELSCDAQNGNAKRPLDNRDETDAKRFKYESELDLSAKRESNTAELYNRITEERDSSLPQKENVETSSSCDNVSQETVSAFRKVDRESPSGNQSPVDDRSVRVDMGIHGGYSPDSRFAHSRHRIPYPRSPTGDGVGINEFTNMHSIPSVDSIANRNFTNKQNSAFIANSPYLKMMDIYNAQHQYTLQNLHRFTEKVNAQQPIGNGISITHQKLLSGCATDVARPYKCADMGAEKLLRNSFRPLLASNFSSVNMVQNWCVKCNATFRMTSDLVYHMRSQHHREYDPSKKKRDDKLSCDVCGETFRERHHLSRHMTSHL